MSTPQPTQIGRYRIEGVLGHGGMGVVYLGFDPGLGRRVAIKTVRKALQAGQAWNPVERFQREARAAARLSHPHIVTVHELAEDAHSTYLVCEHVAGASLEATLQREGRPALAQALRWMAQLLDALQHVHAHGIVHRDVKASNLLLTPGGELKLTDFGIAHVDTAPRTQVGLMIGTPGCMAPEQMRGGTIDGRADTFAAGVLMYELLTGRRPWSGCAEELMEQILSRLPEPPSVLRPEAAALDGVVLRALAPTPAQRFESAAAFRNALLAAGAPFATSAETRPAQAAADATRLLARTVRTPALEPAGACSAALLQRVETTLRSHVGPIAGVLVSRASRSAPDFDALLQQLARHIPAQAERERFLDTLHGAGTRLTAAAARTGATLQAAVPRPGTAVLDEAQVAQVVQRLALHLGPMAGLAVRRARIAADSLPALVRLAAQGVPDARARRRFLADCGLTAEDGSR
jgi:serine/threonine-protein kinase